MGQGTRLGQGLGTVVMAVGLGLLLLPRAIAQTCPYAILRIETTRPLDTAAICAAAQPWAAAQYELLIYVTDLRPTSEETWLSQVDQVEIGAGLRQAGPQDRFRIRGFTLAMTTATDLPYAIVFTRGEALADTPLGSSPPAREAVRQRMRGLMAAQDGTGAIVLGLRELGQLANLGAGATPGIPSGVEPGVEAGPGVLNRLLAVLTHGVVLVLVLGGGLIGGARLWWVKGHRRYLRRLQDGVANLLMACDGVVNAGPVEMTTAYLAFGAAGGEAYPDRRLVVVQALTQARQLLDRVFQSYGVLLEQPPATSALKDSIRDWQRLYLVLMGNDPTVTALDDRALQDLLTPSTWSGGGGTGSKSPGLLTQLEAQQSPPPIVKLRVDRMMGSSSEEEPTVGVLGYLAQVQAVVVQLHQARATAPQRLAKVQETRPSWERLIPATLGGAPGLALAGIDRAIGEAVTALEQGLYLKVMDLCDRIDQAVAVLTPLAATLTQGENTLGEVARLQAAGYRPPTLPAIEQQVRATRATLVDLLNRSQYESLGETLAQWQRLVADAQDCILQWQALQQANATQLADLERTCERLRRLVDGEVARVWSNLQVFPRSNWSALESVVAEVSDRLQRAETVTLPKQHQRNSLESQEFTGVKLELERLRQEFEEIEALSQRVLDCYQQVLWVRSNLVREVAEIRNYLRQTRDLVQAKLLGLVAMGPGDSRLEQAERCLTAAEASFQARHYLKAAEQRDQGLRLVLVVYREKVEAQAEDMRPLTTQSGVSRGRSLFQETMAALPSLETINETRDLALFQLFHRLTSIRQDLQMARRRCKEEARSYHLSSSSASSASESSSWSSSSDAGSSGSDWGSSSSDAGSSGSDWGSSSRD